MKACAQVASLWPVPHVAFARGARRLGDAWRNPKMIQTIGMATSRQTNQLKPTIGNQHAIHESGPLASHGLFAGPKASLWIVEYL